MTEDGKRLQVLGDDRADAVPQDHRVFHYSPGNHASWRFASIRGAAFAALVGVKYPTLSSWIQQRRKDRTSASLATCSGGTRSASADTLKKEEAEKDTLTIPHLVATQGASFLGRWGQLRGL